MGLINFYHLTQSAPEQVLSNLASRALEQGWKIELRGRDLARLEQLDLALWSLGETSFLPHGMAGGPHDVLQPILLTMAPSGDGRQAVMAVDGAEVAASEADTHERVWILFDGHDPEALQKARAQWKALTSEGAKAAYWSEESGRWQKKAES
ncbi:DNA polymerase III subunit chi [Thioclava dalianensis]|uniref:DNA polymerase III subunit chi n=1 Tax=Thioclava dalianensis TaxID=1185766 RepID=A0A074TA26_9RHOB|nr:DNA polymerase III subunit chi [Thioclava dalianensis]KEP68554.1 DNA polymerase III subunit chi [Thioclava dalianensis]SFN57929.1 DNA polymerase III, chi subunit [Thioclava dalianensis]